MVRGGRSLRKQENEEGEDSVPGLGSRKGCLADTVAVGEAFGLNSGRSRKRRKYSRLRQQEIGAATLFLTVKRVILIFFAFSIVFIPLGVIFLASASSVVEVVIQYDDKCWDQWSINLSASLNSSSLTSLPPSWNFSRSADRENYIRDTTTPKTCNLSVVLPHTMKSPIFVYYEVSRFYQNHALYVRSVSTVQLLGRNVTDADLMDTCSPQALVNISGRTEAIRPCGLIAWSNFNDTYTLHVNGTNGTGIVEVSDRGIAWKADKADRFASVEAVNLNTVAERRGGGEVMGLINQNERLMNWMRIAPGRRFRKLWGRIDGRDLSKGSNLTIQIENQFNTFAFGGEKKFILSTATWLGGASTVVGIAYLTVGCLSLFFALFFFVANWKWPRPLGDPSYLSWNRRSLLSSQTSSYILESTPSL
ncbi:hypothetical protein CBR_g6595 [Chara braunii]|uniref:ALA-interacting subunit n=1 Tax=Chara braunii TaxID=69332 RepID=A0A388KKB1_CHABU|nr:hypothetical protein CBR_g6595 [Chara braunii]|eukprot:GBG70467.1 hypothetical protein CBR_g6595 [Chara braunii]